MAAWVLSIGAVVAQQPSQDPSAEPWRAQLEEARRLWQNGDRAGAEALLDQAVLHHPDAATLFFVRARYRTARGDYAASIADCNRAIELAPNLAEAWLERGYARMQQRELPAAIADFDVAIRLAPGDPSTWGDRGDARQRMGDWLNARADYDMALRLDPDFGAALHNRAIVNTALCAWRAAARDQRRAIAFSPPMARMWSMLADAQLHLGRWRLALSSTRDGLQLKDPECLAELSAQAAHAHWRLGERAEAIAVRQQALADSTSPAQRAMQHQQIGCLQLAIGQVDDARASFAEAMQQAELRPWATLMQWCTHPDNATADRELRAAVAAWPTDTPQWASALAERCLTGAPPPLPTRYDELTHLCMDALLRAWRARRDGDAEKARQHLLVCIATGRTDSAQWQIAFAVLGLHANSTTTLGCEVREVDGAAPQLEVTAVSPFGPAELRGLRVGDRIGMVNDQPATLGAFRTASAACVPGTLVRFAMAGDPPGEVRVAAGVALD